MFHLFEILLFTLAALYCGTLIWLRLGLLRLKSGNNSEQPLVSVVVAARNEEANIGACLDALINQTYPKEKTELIIVDDRSEDGTASIVRKFATEHPEIRITLKQIRDNAPDISPKKRALELGIRDAKGEVIFVTDADCRPIPTWLAETVRYFEPRVGLVAGFSPLELPFLHGLGKRFVALDSLALTAIIAGSIGWNWPATCSGRNLSYRKSVFEQVDGFSEIRGFVSGDDDLFLHLIRKRTNWEIRYAATPKAIVPSFVPKSLYTFMQQRIRHASKGRHYGSILTPILMGVYVFNVLLFAAVPLSLFNVLNFYTVILTLLAKMLFEFVLLSVMARRMNRWHYLKVFPLAALLHILYVVIFGLLGQVLKFNWKGESFSTKAADIAEFAEPFNTEYYYKNGNSSIRQNDFGQNN